MCAKHENSYPGPGLKSGVAAALHAGLRAQGLRILHIHDQAWLPQGGLLPGRTLVVGHAGGEFWHFFAASAEYADGRPDPLDRWSARVITAAAPDLRFVAPSAGPPYAPLHYLCAGGDFSPSPLGLLIAHEVGLWTAIRGLLVRVDERDGKPGARPKGAKPTPPCQGCRQPCLKACPVSAFGPQGFDASRCADYLTAHRQASCWQGCLARRACPVAPHLAYGPAQAKFYMDSFTRAMEGPAQ